MGETIASKSRRLNQTGNVAVHGWRLSQRATLAKINSQTIYFAIFTTASKDQTKFGVETLAFEAGLIRETHPFLWYCFNLTTVVSSGMLIGLT